MTLMRRHLGRFPLGVWLALLALTLLVLGWAMQAYSLLDWDSAVELGLQNDRFGADPASAALAKESWGVAVADLLWALPLTLLGIVGLLRRQLYGFVAAMMAFAIGVYFPLVFLFGNWSKYQTTAIAALALWLAPCLLAIAGLWANRRAYTD